MFPNFVFFFFPVFSPFKSVLGWTSTDPKGPLEEPVMVLGRVSGRTKLAGILDKHEREKCTRGPYRRSGVL